MAIYNGIDTESRERVYSGDPDHFESDREFGREVARTTIGQKFLSEFEFSSNFDLIMKAVRTLNPDPNEPITVSKFVNALDVVMQRPGKLVKRVAEPAVEEEPAPPVHRGQQMWKEHHEFMEHGGKDGGMPSGDEVRAHARESKSFRAYLRQGYEARMSGEIGGAGTVLNARAETKPAPPELVAWAEEYKVTPMAAVRQRMRADFNPHGYEQYKKMFDEAVAFGLI